MKKNRRLLVATVFSICIFLLYSFFHIGGSEIRGVSEISTSSTITVLKYSHPQWDARSEFVLNKEQIHSLKTLLEESSFTRVLSNAVQFQDMDRYDIRINFDDEQEPLSISCIGNEYISVIDQFDGKHLKIKNPQWKETLEVILQSK